MSADGKGGGRPLPGRAADSRIITQRGIKWYRIISYFAFDDFFQHYAIRVTNPSRLPALRYRPRMAVLSRSGVVAAAVASCSAVFFARVFVLIVADHVLFVRRAQPLRCVDSIMPVADIGRGRLSRLTAGKTKLASKGFFSDADADEKYCTPKSGKSDVVA